MRFLYYVVVQLLLLSFFPGCKTKGTLMPPGATAPGYIEGFSNACFLVSTSGEIDSIRRLKKIVVEMPSPRELVQIQQITDYIGLPQNFSIYKGDVPNAMSTVVLGKRIIVYRKDLLSRIDRTTSSEYWSSYFILAHEIGHHLANHFFGDSIVSYQNELQADRFAGSILCRLGATIQEATKAMTAGFLFAGGDTTTHPRPETRIKAIEEGWHTTMNQMNTSFALPPPPINDDRLGDEEYTHDALEVKEIGDYPIDQAIKEKNYYEYEGIITRVLLSDTVRADYTEIDNVEKIQVEIEKDLTPEEKFENPVDRPQFNGLRIWVNVPDGREMIHPFLAGYIGLLERGMKIRFRALVWDSGQNFYMFYIKHITRDK